MKMKVSIIIPAHNEEKIIQNTLIKVRNAMKESKLDYEIIAVDDNSNDNTGLAIDNLSKKMSNIKSVHKKAKKKGPTGLGAAIKFGFKYSSGNIIIPFMGDLSDNPKVIPRFVKKINEGYGVVCGSRFIKGGKLFGYPLLKLIANRLYNRLFAFLFHLDIKDISNAFKAYRREVFAATKPESDGFEITSEIVLKAHIKRYRIIEVPVSWHDRDNIEKSKFGSFISPTFILFKLPRIGVSYGKLSLLLWFKFVLSRIFG